MMLEQTSLREAAGPVEDGALELPLERPVAVLGLHGQLAPVAWAFAQASPGASLGYIQTAGATARGSHSPIVAELEGRGLLAGHLTVGAGRGGEGQEMTGGEALHEGLRRLGWDGAVCGPGPAIDGSASKLGPGGMLALDAAHIALALGCPTLLVARMSSGDPQARHRPISDHTLTVLDLLLEPVTVGLPAGMRSPVGSDLRAGLGSVFAASAPRRPAPSAEVERPARIARHDWRRAEVDLPAYAASGLPMTIMGRGPVEDPLFFAAALAGGTALGELCAAVPPGETGEAR